MSHRFSFNYVFNCTLKNLHAKFSGHRGGNNLIRVIFSFANK